MAKVKVNFERSICVGTHGGFLLTIGEREYHDDVAKAIVVAGFGEYVDVPAVVIAEPVIEPLPEIEPVLMLMSDDVAPVVEPEIDAAVVPVAEPIAEEKAMELVPENKMMPAAPQNKRNKLKLQPAKQPAKTETDIEDTL